jgi:hypothetical protein
MGISTLRVLAVVVLSVIFTEVSAQQEWNVPWTVVGDSADLVEQTRVTLTGRIKVKGTQTPVSGASISVESFKYFDYSDQAGRYVPICRQVGTVLSLST